MTVTIRFACGHPLVVPDPGGAAPICPQCRETRVQHVTAPAPTFRGTCAGPLVRQ